MGTLAADMTAVSRQWFLSLVCEAGGSGANLLRVGFSSSSEELPRCLSAEPPRDLERIVGGVQRGGVQRGGVGDAGERRRISAGGGTDTTPTCAAVDRCSAMLGRAQRAARKDRRRPRKAGTTLIRDKFCGSLPKQLF